MKKIKLYGVVIVCFLVVVPLLSCMGSKDKRKYLGQKPPTLTPEVFALGLISKKNESEFGSVFNKDATEFYYGVDVNGKSEIRFTKLQGGSWDKPQVLLSHDRYSCNDPFLSPDGNRLYFISNKTLLGDGVKEDYDIWYIKKEGNSWNPKMVNAGPNINSDKNEYYCSFSDQGDLYFASNLSIVENKPHDFNIHVSKFVNGSYQKAIPLGDPINTKAYEADVFVAPNETYIIFCSIRKEGFGKGDLYISFKDHEGNWSKAKNMGTLINSESHELCPFVSKDGKYFFYTSDQDIYWMDTRFIDFLKDYQ